MRKTTVPPIVLAVVLVLAPRPVLSQDPAMEAAIAAAPDADATPDAIGLPIPDGSPCASRLESPVRLADVQLGRLLLKTVHAGVYLPAPVLETDVAFHVTGLVARATVSQRFCNPTQLWVEGVYVFPLPENAAVDALTLRAGGHVIEGQIKERAEAQQIYEQAKAAGKKASLLEQQRPNLFTTALANLGPGEVAEVRIEYQQELRYDGGRFSLRFPMVDTPLYMPGGPSQSEPDSLRNPHLPDPPLLGGEEGEQHAAVGAQHAAPVPEPPRSEERINPVHLTIDLEAGFPLARLESGSHAIRSRQVDRGHYQIDLAAGVVPADRDFILEWTPTAGAAPEGTLLTQQVGSDTYALLMLMPPQEAAGQRFDLPRETVYIIDTSGSMAGASIREAKAALDLALTRLAPGDSFNVIEFNSTTRVLYPSSLPATPGNVEQAREFVAGLEANNGTEMMGALQAALGDPSASQAGVVRQVIFMTDGAVGNEDELFAYISEHLGDSRLFTVGIGSAPNSFFMTKAAEFGRGTFTYIGTAEEVAPKMGALFAKLSRPALAGVEAAWSDPEAESYPPRIPDLYHGEPIVVVTKLLSAFPGEVTLAGSATGSPWKVNVKALPAAEGAGLDKLWARRKITELGSQLALGGDAAKLRPAIVELGLAHHLVTEFTSLVAVDTTPTAPAGARPETTLIPVNVPAGWENGFEEGTLPQGGTSARLDLLIGSLLLASSCLFFLFGRRSLS
ncbi:MAG TPA: marine proteobacterial sortase target protein [Thermoanaerobaculia bacterium]|jgi:Ca-activated chloride channel family protein|nr:marine proteobacterial sortase target protein [Thermoanaerobaculia bacterium]